MWLFTSKGMISVVSHREHSDHLMIRARSKYHLDAQFPSHEILFTPEADYPFRIIITRKQFCKFIGNYIAEMSYDNFKNSINEVPYRDHCGKVWSTMYSYGSIFG